MSLRDYQVESVDRIFAELASVRATLLVLPTGCGKTVVFSEVARRWNAEGRGRVLVIAHREELIQQARDKMERFGGLKSTIERADERGDAAGMFASPVVVATVQTMGRPSRHERYAPDAFGLVIVDEAHRTLGDQYRAVLDYFAGAKVLGVTATPDRSDGAALGKVFETCAFDYGIRDAIDKGYLVPIRQHAVSVESLDLSRVRTTAGDLNEGDLEAILTEESNLHGVAYPTIELAGDRPTLIFAATVAHARGLAEVINRHRPFAAVPLDGSSSADLRRTTLRDFREGRFQFLLNCALFLEGFDEPSISCVAMARPTKSRSLYAQALGRGTRLNPPNKTDLLVLDFEGNAGRHALVSAVDVLAGDEDLETLAKARELARAGMRTDEALDQARTQVADERRRKVIAKARYQSVEIDPFQVLGATVRKTAWSNDPATDKQRGFLELMKIPVRPEVTRGEASALIDASQKRKQANQTSYAQARLLARYGLDPDMSREQASVEIQRLKDNGWRRSAVAS